MLSLVLAISQLKEPLNPQVVTKLGEGERVRYYKAGGRTRNGLYQCLITVTMNRVWVKTNEVAKNWALTPSAEKSFKEALNATKPKDFTKRLRQAPGWPSAYDGADQYITYRSGKLVFKGNNFKYDVQTQDSKLIELLESYESTAIEMQVKP